MYRTRVQLEAIERASLAPYAVQSGDSRGRFFADGESEYRTAFQKDRDRVLHTSAFRRLEYKTQVFVNFEGDYYRTRLTHTLEVVQVARTIARTLGVNEDLTETIALAHDLGHPPFGHTGEDVLNRLMRNHGGFEHNRQTYRVVTLLEKRYTGFDGLNLTWETLEGLVKHEREHQPPEIESFEPSWRPSLEASIADAADAIAYSTHDLDDGLRSGLIKAKQLEAVSLWRRISERLLLNPKNVNEFERRILIRELLGEIVSDLIHTTSAHLERHSIGSLEDVRRSTHRLVAHSAGMTKELRELKKFLFEHLYRHPHITAQRNRAERILESLFERYTHRPDELPETVRVRFEVVGLERAVCDYLAGMTDRYATDEGESLFPGLRR